MPAFPLRRPLVLLLLGLLLAAPPVHAQDEDPLALASLLISDGNWDRAAGVLQALEPDQKGLDQGRYFSLSGLVALQQQDYPRAAAAFQQAIAVAVAEADTRKDAPGVDPTLYLYLSRAQLLGGEARAAIATLDRGGDVVDSIPSAWLIRARAARELSDLPAAYAALDEGARRFPAQRDFPRQQILLLVEMGLTREAGERATAMLTEGSASAEDSLIVGEALRKSGALDRAAIVLQAARLRFPEEPEILVRQAAVAVDAGQPLAAARFLQIAAEYDLTYAHDAAELFRRAGQLQSALYMNAMVADPTEKVRQRFGLLLVAEQYEHAVALTERLRRLGLLSEDDIAYGLAYAHFRVGDLETAEGMLRSISDPELFQKATALRQAMERCAESPEACS